MISSNSGGSWYAAEALYSSSFVDLLDAMGRQPEQAGELFAQRWVRKLLHGQPGLGQSPAEEQPAAAAAAAAAAEEQPSVQPG
eukprot:5300086-Heterocapsa_arctica.AAC.1